MIEFKDEIGQGLNRYQLVPVQNSADTYDFVRDADIQQERTPLNANNLNKLADKQSIEKYMEGSYIRADVKKIDNRIYLSSVMNAKRITFTAPAPFSNEDLYYYNDSLIQIMDMMGLPIGVENSWTTGSPVDFIILDKSRAYFKAEGSTKVTIPPIQGVVSKTVPSINTGDIWVKENPNNFSISQINIGCKSTDEGAVNVALTDVNDNLHPETTFYNANSQYINYKIGGFVDSIGIYKGGIQKYPTIGISQSNSSTAKNKDQFTYSQRNKTGHYAMYNVYNIFGNNTFNISLGNFSFVQNDGFSVGFYANDNGTTKVFTLDGFMSLNNKSYNIIYCSTGKIDVTNFDTIYTNTFHHCTGTSETNRRIFWYVSLANSRSGLGIDDPIRLASSNVDISHTYTHTSDVTSVSGSYYLKISVSGFKNESAGSGMFTLWIHSIFADKKEGIA